MKKMERDWLSYNIRIEKLYLRNNIIRQVAVEKSARKFYHLFPNLFHINLIEDAKMHGG